MICIRYGRNGPPGIRQLSKGRKQVLRGLAERRMRELILFYRHEFELPTRMPEWK